MKELETLEKLQKLRKKEGYSLQDMADKLGVCRAFYWQLEHRKRRMTYDRAIEIANIFHMRPDDIFYEEFKKKPYHKRKTR